MPTLTHNLFWGVGEKDFRLDVIEGAWPTDIEGAAFIVGPDKRRPGGHWFNEHGLLCKIHCAPDASDKVRVQLKLINTPLKKLRDRLPSLFRKLWVLEASPFGFTNLANTNVQPLGGRLFVGYDVGRPAEVDPETLEFLTFVGRNDEWAQTLPATLEPMISVAAHPAPAYEESALYFVNYVQNMRGGTNKTWVARWPLDGPVERWPLEGMSRFDSIHDIKATRDYLVITDLPFVVEPGTFRGKPRKKANQDHTQLWLVKKADLRGTAAGQPVAVKELRIPMGSGHIAIDYENPGGIVQVYLQHIPAADLTLSVGPKERAHFTGNMFDPNYEGLICLGLQPPVVGRYRIDAEKGELLEKKLACDPEKFWGGILWTQNLYTNDSQGRAQNLFYGSMGWDPDLLMESAWNLYKDYAHTVVPMDNLPKGPLPGALSRVDLESMEFADQYTYEGGAFPHPPTFIPRKNCKHDLDGYVIVIVHRNGPKEVQLFDAQNLAQGPLARASAPDFNPPLMLHSCWMAPRKGPRPSNYRINPVRDAWGALKEYPAKAAEIAGFVRGAAR